MRLRFSLQSFTLLILILGLALALIGPDVYESWRRASACYVLGGVIRPGKIETLGTTLTVRDAIEVAGGLMPGASPGHIRLVRPSASGEQVLNVDLSDPATNHVLKPGDRLIIHRGRNVSP
jgi:protein involved in polysaccharide export with SLBB domain